MGKFVETLFHELEHESKMRLLKTHSHTSEQRGYEAGGNVKNTGKGVDPARQDPRMETFQLLIPR